ncbi:MAG: hypothetical protein J6S40_00470, partial [Thermoguttaceae bacterium]|nr:hypothetical protein [Thermoguttaceae bacterium]
MNFLKNRRFQLESLEERTLLTAAPWSTADETDYSGLVVTTLEDVVDASDQLTSIREAIANAEALDSAATITFAKGLAGKITLSGGALSVDSVYGIAIDGGENIAIDAASDSRVFEIGSGSVTLSNLTLENGYDVRKGGAVYSAGDLTLENVLITDSFSGKFGSAVHAAEQSSLTVIDSSFVNNTAKTHGGGVFVDKGAQAQISGSTFTGNAAGTYGGAVYVWDGAVVDITNSFFTNNTAPNGTIRNHGGQLTLTNVVISGNEQGLSASGGTTTATNVTISNNTRSAVRGADNASFLFYNSIVIDGYKTVNFGYDTVVGGDNNLSDVPFGINFIKYNGGDLFAADGYTLWGNNQAADAGNPAYNTTSTDAAGNDRYYGGALDLGALEQVAYAYGTTVVFNGEDQTPVAFDGPVASVQYSADGETWTDTLGFRNAGSYTFWVAVGAEAGEEEIYEVTGTIAPLQLTVSGSAVVSRDYNGGTDAEIIVGEVSTLYDEVIVTGTGEFSSAEPGVHNVAVTYAVSGDLAGNYIAPADEILRGEIIKTEDPSLVVTTLDDVVDTHDNLTSLREAAAYAETFETAVTVTFADDLEGTIALADSSISIGAAESITIDAGGRITIDAGGDKRAFVITSGAVTLANLTITGGFDEKMGGAVYSEGDLTLNSVLISDSYSGKFGSAVHAAAGTNLTVVDSAFINNTTSSHGGGIFVDQGATASISGSYFSGNVSEAYGAAVYLWDGSVVDIADSIFVNNTAPNGTIRNHAGTLSLINTVVSGNQQGISTLGGVTTAVNVTVSGNEYSAIRGEDRASYFIYNSILTGGHDVMNLDSKSTADGDNNLGTSAFGTNFTVYDGGDLFAADGYTLWGNNQAFNAGNPEYNNTEFDAVGNNRYYAGALDLGAVEQVAYAYGDSVVFNGSSQSLVKFDGPVAWAQYSEDGETWTDELTYRDAGVYTFFVKVGTETGEEETYEVTAEITPLQLTAEGTFVRAKFYDGTDYADVVIGNIYTLYDDVTVSASGEYASAEIGVWDVEVTYAVSGELAENYIAPVGETVQGEIYRPDSRSLVVTTLDDVVDPDDDFNSLREAVAYAETLGKDAEITFNAGLEGVITLTGGAISIDASDGAISIDGDGRITVDAGGADRAFEVAAGETLLKNISIENGFATRQGGAISNAGNLTLDNVKISNSYSGKYGGAVYTAPEAHLTVIDSSFVDNTSKSHGGAIFVEKGASADISGSYFTGNSNASYGAAVYLWNDSTVNIANTMFVGNIAPNGTIRNYGGTLYMINVVIAGNDQGFSSSAAGTNTAVNVTITGNLRSSVRGEEGSTFVFYNSILMNDSDPEIEGQVGPIDMRTGATIDGDNNLSTIAFGSNFVMYDGGDLFAEDGYTLVGHNQAMNAGSAQYNDSEFDAAGRNRYYAGAIDLGGMEQICVASGTTIAFDGETHSPVEFDGPVSWAQYSFDGETWSDELALRNAGTYDLWVKCGTDTGDEELYQVTVEITPLQLTVIGSAVVDKDYDGTTDAEIIVGEVATLYDDVTVVGAGQFASAEEGTWDVDVTYTVVGDLAGNYVAPAGETLRGSIYMPEASSLVVTTLDDVVDRYDGETSIREAIAYAETFDEAVTVTFAEGLEGTITLADGAVGVDAAAQITVDGGARITIDAAGESRAFEINSGAVTLADLTIENGSAEENGGAIANSGELTLVGVTISDSRSGKIGGAVYSAPDTVLTVIDSTFTGNAAQNRGGAIYVDQWAVAEISGSYFSGNSTAAYGAAVYAWNDSTVDIANSIFVENVAPNGTIRNHAADVSLINVVVSGNEQGISGIDGGVTTATNVTISNNARSAVRGDDGASFIFYNSILVGDTVLALSDNSSIGGSTNLSTKSFGNNFIAYNGGDLFAEDGYTLTGDNQAMNAGNAAYNDTEFDAAGNDRYYGGALDLGAVEQLAYAYGTSVVYNGQTQAPVGFYGPVAWAQYSEDGQTWSDTPSVRNAGTYTLWVKVGTGIEGEEEVYQVTGEITPLQLTVSGSSVTPHEYDGTTDAEIVVGEVATLYDDVTVAAAGEFASAEPGVWDVAVTYSVSGDLAGNYLAPVSETLEGEIYKPIVGSLVVTTLDDVVDPNDDVNSLREAIAYAEALDAAATVTFADGLEGTIVLADGALAVDASNAAITIDGGNVITIDAGAVSNAFAVSAGDVTLRGLTVENGYGARYGGAIYNAGDLTLDEVTIANSYSGKYGGAVYSAVGSTLTVTDSTFTDNASKSHGGAIFVEKGVNADISGSYFSGNSNVSYGGAVYLWNDAVVNISDSIFVGNTSPNGTVRNYGGELNMINVVLSGNEQGFSSSDGGKNTATNVTVSNNLRSAVRGETGASFVFYNSILIGGYSTLNLSADSTIGGDTNLSDVPFGNNFIAYDGGDLFAEDGYTLWGDNQAQGVGKAKYNDTEFDAVGNNRYYGGALDLGAVEQIVYAYGTTVIYNGEFQAPVGFYGPVTWAQYSEDGQRWSDVPLSRNVGTYTFYVKCGTDIAGEEEIYQVTGTITPLQLTVSGTTVADKAYDGTADAEITLGEVTGVISGDHVDVTVSGAFPSSDVGTYDVEVAYSLLGSDSSNYTAPITETVTASITPAEIEGLSFDDTETTYDGQSHSITLEGTEPTDTVLYSLDGETWTAELPEYTDAGTYDIYVKVSRDNYEDWTGEATLTIDPKQLTVSGTKVADKVYDGTTGAEITLGRVSGIVPGDDVTVTAEGAFPSADAGTYDVGVTYTVDNPNYIAPAAETFTASIAEGAIDVTFDDLSLVYDGEEHSVAVVGAEAGDTVLYSVDGETYSAELPAYTDAGTYQVYAKVSRENYADWTGSATLDIAKVQLTVTGSAAQSKVYDGTTDATILLGTVAGVVLGDDLLVVASGRFASPEVGTHDVTITYTLTGDDAANYIAPAADAATASITSAPSNITFTGGTYVYDGQEHTFTLEGAGASDTVLYSLDGETFDIAEMPAYTNAGIYTVYVQVTSADRDDWTGSAVLTITPRQIEVTGTTVAGKVYDGTTDATVLLGTTAGILIGDDVTVVATGVFENAGVGEQTADVTYTLAGDDAANYIAPISEKVNAEITPAPAEGYVFAGGNVMYDGQEHTFTLSGTEEGDKVRYSLDGVTFDIVEMPAYTDAGTYTVYVKVESANYADWTGEATLKIAPREITVTGTTVDDKVYDADTAASIRLGTVKGIIVGEDVTITYSGAFAGANIGEYDVVVSYGMTGANTGNYVLITETSTDTAEITARTITVVGSTVADKVYDGNVNAEITLGTLFGVVDGDDVDVAASGAFGGKDVGAYDINIKYALSGSSSGNYVLASDSAATRASITPLQITVSGSVAHDKVYDGTTGAAVTPGTTVGIISGDDVTVSASGQFSDSSVGEHDVYVTYTISG